MENIFIILVVVFMGWIFVEIFRWELRLNKRKDASDALKSKNNPYELIKKAKGLYDSTGFSIYPVGEECLLKALKNVHYEKNPDKLFELYESLGGTFFLYEEEELMHECYERAKKYYVPNSQDELYYDEGKPIRRKRKKF